METRLSKDEYYMRRAIKLALKGQGTTSPNPMVGAIIVKNGKIVGEGFHRVAGNSHAEILAIEKAGTRAQGGTLYVNLEPCCHLGKRTPPCTRTILKSHLRRVVVAMKDPNPEVNGKGLKILRQAGMGIEEGLLATPAGKVNEFYTKFIQTGTPFVISKAALSLDGKISFNRGFSSRITGEMARIRTHRLRNQVDAILVGLNTVLIDNPNLTTRLPSKKGRDPLRVILDCRLSIPFNANVLKMRSNARTIIAYSRLGKRKKVHRLKKMGAILLKVPGEKGRINLRALLKLLGQMNISSLLIEGGGEVNASAFSEGIVDKLVWFFSPKIAGNRGVDLMGEIESRWPANGIPIFNFTSTRVGNDILFEGYLNPQSY